MGAGGRGGARREGPPPRGLHRRDGQVTVSEGPFAETVEQLGGFYLLDVPDLDTVLDLVAMLPEDTIEIRPVVDHGGS